MAVKAGLGWPSNQVAWNYLVIVGIRRLVNKFVKMSPSDIALKLPSSNQGYIFLLPALIFQVREKSCCGSQSQLPTWASVAHILNSSWDKVEVDCRGLSDIRIAVEVTASPALFSLPIKSAFSQPIDGSTTGRFLVAVSFLTATNLFFRYLRITFWEFVAFVWQIKHFQNLTHWPFNCLDCQ